MSTGQIAEWARQLFAAIDAADADGFAAFLTEDAVFRFGNMPEVRGRDAIRAAVNGFWASIRKSEHRLLRYWQGGGAAAVDGWITYTRHDGSQVTVPFADVFVMRGNLVSEYLIYIDMAPLFAPPAAS